MKLKMYLTFIVYSTSSISYVLNKVFIYFLLLFTLLFAISCGKATIVNTSSVPEKITISFDTQGGNTVPDQTITKDERLTLKYSNPTMENHQFDGWYNVSTGGVKIDLNTKKFTTKTTLYAQWKRIVFNVVFNLNGDNTTGKPEIQIVKPENTAIKPITQPQRIGYIFIGWYQSATPDNNTQAFDFATIINEDKTLYAKWNLMPIIVTFYGLKPNDATTTDNIAGLPNPKTVSVNSGDTVNEPTPVPTLAGYRLKAWHNGTVTNGVVTLSDTAFDFSIPIRGEDINLYTKWEYEPIAITFNFNYNNAPTIESIFTSAVNRKITTFPTIPNERMDTFNLNGWYTEESGGDKIDFESKTFTTTQTLYAQWTRIHIVTFNYNYPTSANKNVRVNTGEMISIENANPLPDRSPHYTLTEWYTTKIPSTDTIFNFQNTPINEDITLYAKWTRAIYTVTFNYNYGINPHTTTAMSNQLGLVAKPADPTRTDSSMQNFLNWYSQQNPTDTDRPFLFTTPILEDKTLYVKWIEKLRLIFDTQGGSDVPDQILDNGETPKKPDNPVRQHFAFVNWYNMDTGGTVYAFNTPITNEKTIYAHWRHRPETKEVLLAEVNRAISADGNNVNLNFIDTSLIIDMSQLFIDKTDFIGNISNWNVANVKNMSWMFAYASSFNGNISNWNVSNVNNMNFMFYYAHNFNQNLNNWNVANVQYIRSMFARTNTFNGNISNWNVANVEDMSWMFSYSKNFNQDLNNWNVANVEDMNNMFTSAPAFNGRISSWNVSAVKKMEFMFIGARKFNQNLNNWNVANVQNMNAMFASAFQFNGNISNWNVANVQNMNTMFASAFQFNGNISNWNVANVQNMNAMFRNATKFNGNISNWNVANVQNMSQMFNGASAFIQNIDSWNVATTVTKTDAFIDSGLANSPPSWAN